MNIRAAHIQVEDKKRLVVARDADYTPGPRISLEECYCSDAVCTSQDRKGHGERVADHDSSTDLDRRIADAD